MDALRLPGVPSPLWWENPPEAFEGPGEHGLRITAGAATDLFRDPRGDVDVDDSPRLLFRPAGDFVLSATVHVEFARTFDAGVLMLHGAKRHWAKLCFERSPEGRPSIVSVVNDPYSDDCNSVPIDGDSIRLRVARMDGAAAFHYGHDAGPWHLVRYFTFEGLAAAAAGISAQSPQGPSCRARFSDVRYEERTLEDVRSGA